jgi:hypothetical protein
MIRARSAAGELCPEAEILNLLPEGPVAVPEMARRGGLGGEFLGRLLNENADLHRLCGAGSPCYYSDRHMTAAYSRLLLHKQEGPLRLIAETVRCYCREFRRPLALAVFAQAPFDLEQPVLREYLARMSQTEEYDDIAMVTTSEAGIYLYATSCLEHKHAEMLAEWLDVGQDRNP